MRFKTINDIDKMANAQLIPIQTFLELTYKCNLRCVHCYADSPGGAKELSFEEIISVLEQLAKAGSLYLTLGGGEPLLRKDFIDIVAYARKLGFAVIILTNATPITEGLADRISALFPMLVKVGLYGATEETYGRTTARPRLFHSAIRGIRLLSERKVPLRVSSQIFNYNPLEDALAMKRICEGSGAEWIASPGFVLKANGSPGPIKYTLSESQFAEFYKRLPQARPTPNHKRNANERVCRNLRSKIHINPYGRVSSCFPLIRKGNLRERPFLDIWRSDPVLKAQRELRWKDLPKCMKCESLPYCLPCSAANFSSSGSLTKIPADFCRYPHMVKRAVERLK